MALPLYFFLIFLKKLKINSGLPNQRNTCYINASLQCLRYIPELRKCIKNIKLPESSLSKILENLFEKLDAKKNINDSLNKVLNLIFKSKQVI